MRKRAKEKLRQYKPNDMPDHTFFKLIARFLHCDISETDMGTTLGLSPSATRKLIVEGKLFSKRAEILRKKKRRP